MPTVEELQAALAAKDAELATAKAKFSTIEAQSATLQAQFDAMKAETKKREVDNARAKFTAMLEDAVKANAITPAQRESFAAVLGIDDDDRVLTLKEDTVKSLFATKPNAHNDQHGLNGDDENNRTRADAALVTKTHEYMAKTGEKDFQSAMFSVMRADQHLAVEYVQMNGEVN